MGSVNVLIEVYEVRAAAQFRCIAVAGHVAGALWGCASIMLLLVIAPALLAPLDACNGVAEVIASSYAIVNGHVSFTA